MKKLKKGYTPEEKKKAQKEAEDFPEQAFITEDASSEEWNVAKQKAKQLWEENGKVANWGCKWYQAADSENVYASAVSRRFVRVSFKAR